MNRKIPVCYAIEGSTLHFSITLRHYYFALAMAAPAPLGHRLVTLLEQYHP